MVFTCTVHPETYNLDYMIMLKSIIFFRKISEILFEIVFTIYLKTYA